MKIAHIVDSMEMGGAETLVSQMCELQREAGHDPCVYAVADLGTLGKKMRKQGFNVQSNLGGSFTELTRNFYHHFSDARPDVVHLHNLTPTVYAAPPARMAGVCSIISTRHSLVAPPHNVIAELKYAVAARFCDWITGICEATTENVRKLHTVPARKLACVYNGASPIRRAAKEEWPAKDGFTLVYLGRIEPVKNHPLLLTAFRDALVSMPDLRLWMVGEGSERKGLEKLATDLAVAGQVKFWGQQLDVAPFLSAADAFIMSSKSEGLPISLLQALSLGLPVIVTDVGGMAEVVNLANVGFTASLKNPTEMTAAILRMAANNQEREQFARNAEATFNSRFSLHSMVDAYMKLYQNTSRAQRTAKG